MESYCHIYLLQESQSLQKHSNVTNKSAAFMFSDFYAPNICLSTNSVAFKFSSLCFQYSIGFVHRWSPLCLFQLTRQPRYWNSLNVDGKLTSHENVRCFMYEFVQSENKMLWIKKVARLTNMLHHKLAGTSYKKYFQQKLKLAVVISIV